MIVSCAEMRAAEEQAFSLGASAENLMDEAAGGIAAAIWQFFPKPGTLVLYLGKGNNAGDALAVGRLLAQRGWRVWLRRSSSSLGALAQRKLDQLAQAATDATKPADFLRGAGPLVLVDGLVGIGARGALRDWAAQAAIEINSIRLDHHASVVAIDIPSGVDGDMGTIYPDAVEADLTCTIGAPKSGLLSDTATSHVGRICLVPLHIINKRSLLGGSDTPRLLTPDGLVPHLPHRGFDFHKGEAGRVSIVAGSKGMLGAACLCAEGVLRAGAGLITLFALEEDYPILASRAPAEVLVRPVASYLEVLDHRADALAIGPGLGLARKDEVAQLCRTAEVPAVLDADALNALAAEGGIPAMAGPRLLTPHPGEMARLVHGDDSDSDRATTARNFAQAHPDHSLLLKGARTIIATNSEPLVYNTTGTPGMATGGMGDVLSGVAAALLASNVSPHQAGCLGSWLLGRAGERAISEAGDSVESVSPSHLLAQLGGAFQDLRERVF